MSNVIAVKCAEALVRQHTEERGQEPDARQRDGYRKVGGQFERFYLQYRTVKDMDRCRQILFANIPKICEDYGLDHFDVHVSVEALCALDLGDLWQFFQSVEEYHESSPKPLQPSLGGCLIPLALVVAVPAALLAARVVV